MVSIADVLHFDNLFAAWEKVRSNQGVGGVDGVSLNGFSADLLLNLETLRNEVGYDTYRPAPLLRVEIAKKDGLGKRPLSIPTIRDRVLQTAVALVLTPVFEQEFEDISFAYRQGRSVGQAVSRIERLRDEGYQWVVDADIRSFFDEVDHDLLMQEVQKLVTDTTILRLIRQWLKATVVDGKERYRLTKGIPQGSPLSPLLANLFLDHLDETLLDNNLRLVRYADDFVVLCKSAARADDAIELTETVLQQLKLSFNQRKTRVVDFNQGFRFLGVQFIRSLAIPTGSPPAAPILPDMPGQEKPGGKTAIPKPAKPKQKPQEKPRWQAYALPRGEQYKSADEMREAFTEAGISPDMFPSEPEPDDTLEPPENDMELAASEEGSPRLKTLYLLEHGSVLGKEYERFVIRKQGLVTKEIPAIHVDQIMVFGNSQLTTQVMQFCLQQRIPVYLLSGHGRYYGIVDSFDTDPVLLHREQFRQADNPSFCLQLARQIVQGKISNSRMLLKRLARHRDAPAFIQASDELAQVINRLDSATSLDQLRGFEGNAARIYFQAIAATLEAAWGFQRRTKKPPTDPVNAMLSYGYTLLFYNIYTFLRSRGLNPHVGYLHPLRMGHPALASDMMEEFRAIIVDAVVLNLALNHKLTPEDFDPPQEEGDACLLLPQARATFIRHLENKLNAGVRHPHSQLKLDYRGCIQHQINHLAAVIRQREPQYLPMVMR